MPNIEGKQDLINQALDNLTKEQVINLLDNPVYRSWIKEELEERKSYRKFQEEEDIIVN